MWHSFWKKVCVFPCFKLYVACEARPVYVNLIGLSKNVLHDCTFNSMCPNTVFGKPSWIWAYWLFTYLSKFNELEPGVKINYRLIVIYCNIFVHRGTFCWVVIFFKSMRRHFLEGKICSDFKMATLLESTFENKFWNNRLTTLL